MKYPLLELNKVMLIFAVTCSTGIALTIWLITKNPIPLAIYIKYGCIGAIVGVWIGAGTGLLFFLQIRRHFHKKGITKGR